MPKRMRCLLLFICFTICAVAVGYGQDAPLAFEKIISSPDKLFTALDKKTASINEKLDRQTEKYLNKLQRKEEKLKKKIWQKDSLLAKQLFPDIEGAYAKLKNTSGAVGKFGQVYSGHLDSLSTSLNFLKGSAPLANNPELQKSLSSLKELQSKFNSADQIKKYLNQRRQLLQEQFERLGMAKELKSFKKEVYYYSAQVKEYKALFEEPSKLEGKLLETLTGTEAFKDFFQKNSLLGSLFSLPGSNSNASSVSLVGLQTRASINQTLVDRFGSGPNVTQYLQGNMQAAQGQLSELKQKALSLSSGSIGSATDGELPDFKPNNQRTKSFLQRLEVGTNLQSQKGSGYFPTTSDIGLSIGYKLNDKSVVGLGTSFKMGWGSGFNDIKITSQGIGLRSFMDYKVKGSIYISGGYELNYRTLINSLDQLKQYDAWARSGLVGVSKRYSVSKKLKGEMKLLWDFLSYQQIPRTQPIVFRIGYSIK